MKSYKAKIIQKLKKESLIVAVDIGKNAHWGYLRAPDGTEVKPFIFYNTQRSFKDFWKRVRQFASKQGLEQIFIGFESTGPYAEPLFHYLKDKAVNLVQVNPMHTKRIKELTGNSPNKNDQKDPRVIADVICLAHALTLVIPEGPAAELRRLTGARERCVEKRTALLNQLQHLIFVIFPEFLGIIKNISTRTGLYLIKNYPTPERILAQGLEPLAAAVNKVSRGRIGYDRIRALTKAAYHSVGVKAGRKAILLEIEHLLCEIESENRFIDKVEKQMAQFLEQIPYSHSILSIKGIGVVTASGLIGEVGDFRKFKTIAEITKLAGLDLYEISSGQRKGQRRISKRGRPMLRKLLFFAAINTIRGGGIMYEKYHQMLERGMLKMKALIAISRKLLAVIFAVVRDNTVYIENYSRAHNYKLAA